MLDVLDKHKLIGGSKGVNTLTYLETTDEDFNEGELKGVIGEHNKLIITPNELYIVGDTYTDNSPNNHTITNNGSTIVDFNPSPLGGKSIRFDGANSYIILPPSLTTDLTDFTYDLYINLGSYASGFSTQLLTSKLSGSTNGFHLGVKNTTSNGFVDKRVIFSQHGSTSPIVMSTTDIQLNTWYHIALVRKGSILYLFVNGRLEASATYTSKIFMINPIVGALSGGEYSINTKMQGIRFNKYALWDDDFVPPTQNSPKVGYRVSPLIEIPKHTLNAKCDWEGEGKIGIVEGIRFSSDNPYVLVSDFNDIDTEYTGKSTVKVNKDVVKVVSKNVTFTQGNSIQISANDDNPLCYNIVGVEDNVYTLEFFIKYVSYTGGQGWVRLYVDEYECFNITQSGANVYTQIQGTGHSYQQLFANPSANTHDHLAITCDSKIVKVFRNGTLIYTIPSREIPTGKMQLRFGGATMQLSELTMCNKVKYTGNFTVPTSLDYKLEEKCHYLEKGKTITSLPSNFQLKQEVEGEETISNVSLEMKYKLEDTSTVPKEEDEENTVYLYNEGDECTDITGGWKAKNFFNHSGGNYAIKQSDCLDYGDNSSSSYGYGGFITNNTIDLTPYSKLCIDWQQYSCSVNKYGSGSGSASNQLELALSHSSLYNSSTGSQGMTNLASITSKLNNYKNDRVITEVDLTNINVQQYVSVFGASGYINTDMSKCKTFAIWLEK